MKERNNARGFKAVGLAMGFCFVAYTIFCSLAMLSYGKGLDPNIFDNIKHDTGIASVALRGLFLLIFLCNIPFVFFPGKACLITFI